MSKCHDRKQEITQTYLVLLVKNILPLDQMSSGSNPGKYFFGTSRMPELLNTNHTLLSSAWRTQCQHNMPHTN